MKVSLTLDVDFHSPPIPNGLLTVRCSEYKYICGVLWFPLTAAVSFSIPDTVTASASSGTDMLLPHIHCKEVLESEERTESGGQLGGEVHQNVVMCIGTKQRALFNSTFQAFLSNLQHCTTENTRSKISSNFTYSISKEISQDPNLLEHFRDFFFLI